MGRNVWVANSRGVELNRLVFLFLKSLSLWDVFASQTGQGEHGEFMLWEFQTPQNAISPVPHTLPYKVVIKFSEFGAFRALGVFQWHPFGIPNKSNSCHKLLIKHPKGILNRASPPPPPSLFSSISSNGYFNKHAKDRDKRNKCMDLWYYLSNDTGGAVLEAYGGLSLVAVLATRAWCLECVHLALVHQQFIR